MNLVGRAASSDTGQEDIQRGNDGVALLTQIAEGTRESFGLRQRVLA
jgi:hypothetical protein